MTLDITRKDINNEIVSLRQFVRQARICTINKLTREAKRLRTNRGSEKQLEKNKNKADKLLKEVAALKRVKEDEISKYGIVNSDHLQSALQDPQSDDRTRAMVKVVRYKSLNAKILEFKVKFPSYNEHISCRPKKQKKKRNNAANDSSKETRKLNKEDVSNDTESEESVQDNDNDVEDSFTDESECATDGKTNETEETNEKSFVESKTSCKQDKQQSNKESKDSKSTNTRKISRTDNTKKQKPVVKVISKEATVKRFTDVLQETNAEDANDNSTENEEKSLTKSIETLREVDDFFLNSDEVSSPSTMISVPEKKRNRTLFVDDSRTRNGGKFHSNERNTENRNQKRQKINGKNALQSQSNFRASYTERFAKQQDKKYTRTDRKSMQGNAISVNDVQNEKLHPSWIAKKKQQEIIKQGFQGKKIKFDEN